MEQSLAEEVTHLVQEHELPLLRYVAAIVHDADLARDLVQETYIKYIDCRRERGMVVNNVKAWLYRVAHNLALDHLRRDKRRQPLDDDLARTLTDGNTDPPDEAAGRHDAHSAALQALDILSERDREVVKLKVLHDKSYKEIAEQLDISVGNVGFILHNSLRKLAKTLQSERV